jgi:hypothetical protein
MVGMATTTIVYLGMGYATIWRLFSGDQPPMFDGMITFLAGGMALFAPYIANQVKRALTGAFGGTQAPKP